MAERTPPKTAAQEDQDAERKPPPANANGNGAQLRQQVGQQDAIALLTQDHRTVEQNFARFEKATRRSEKEKLVRAICNDLVIHAMIEEEIFYPACREQLDADDKLDEAQVEHDSAKLLIRELREARPGDPFYDAKMHTLAEQVRHHVAEEEDPKEGIFAKARGGGVDLQALGQQLQKRKTELVRLAESDRLPKPSPVALGTTRSNTPKSSREEMENDEMAQYYERDYSDGRSGSGRGGRGGSMGNDRPRDEYGRFMSDDDRGGRGGRSGGGRYADDDDDRRGGDGRARSAQARERDEYGRFMSDDDRGGRGGRGGGGRYADDDDDRRGGGGRRTGGWFGDPEGHSRASREGWRTSDHEGSGWYGDREGHSEASRRGWRNSDHEGSGWYGDPEGHSEASRRGWDSRDDRGRSDGRYGRDEDDDRGGRSRSEARYRDDYDDDRGRGRSGRGSRGGWFGDSEGHSQAARRGWDDRR